MAVSMDLVEKILWLNAASPNNDPLIIANYFLAWIKRYKLVPQTLRMDRGTENIHCEDLQVYFTKNAESFVYASSTRNQRIECLWSRLKKFPLNWWINFFSEITKISLFKPHLSSHQECLLFCFLPIIQAELNEVIQTWNLRHVRQSAAAPGAKPDVLFHVTETVGFETKGISVSDSDLNIANHVLGIQHHPVYKNIDLHNLLNCYVDLNEITIPRSAEEALDLYVSLLRFASNDSFEV